MTLSLQTALDLEALAAQLSSATASSPFLDVALYNQIAPVMLAVENRTPSNPTARFTLNITNMLTLRPKRWYQNFAEYNINNPGTSSGSPCQHGLIFIPDTPPGYSWSANSYANTIAYAAGATICKAWAIITRLSISGNYLSSL